MQIPCYYSVLFTSVQLLFICAIVWKASTTDSITAELSGDYDEVCEQRDIAAQHKAAFRHNE